MTFNKDESPELIEKIRSSLSASVAVRVPTVFWFSGTSKELGDVRTGSLSLMLLTEISTSWVVVFKSSLKLTLKRYTLFESESSGIS